MAKDYCFIVKLTDNCNLRCMYCYHFRHKSDHVYANMPLETVDETIEKLIRHNEHYAHFIWHGGEPLLRGIDFYRHIVEKQKEVLEKTGSPIAVSNGIQTNGTLLSKEVIDFFVDNDFHIGISLDGDETLQMADRGMSPELFERMMKAIGYMNDRQARFGALCVVGKNTLGKEQLLFDFYSQNNVNNLGFLPLVIADNKGVDREKTVTPAEYGKFMCNYFDLWVNSGLKGISVREFDDFFRFRMGFQKRLCTNSGECDLYYTVTPDGGIYPCDCFSCGSDNRLGSVTDSIHGLDNSAFIKNLSVNAHRTPEKCLNCTYREMCQGGCAYYRWLSDRNLEEPSYFCSAFKMLYSHISSVLEKENDGR